MSAFHRFEDRGLTLRLFSQRKAALAVPGSHSHIRYATGWVAKNQDGEWIDGVGVIPPDWQPDPSRMEQTE